MAQFKREGVVLVVEDDDDVRELLLEHVRFLGLTPREACDGVEAIKVLDEDSVDVVVSDLVMPKKSGMALLLHMRRKGLELPFIFITGYGTQESTLQAMELGVFDYLEKPFRGDVVRGVIAEAFAARVEQERGRKSRESISWRRNSRLSQPALGTSRYLKMRDHLSEDLKRTNPGEHEVKKFITMFVAEASSHLTFCEGALKSMEEEENMAWEVGFLFRVMQSLRHAAQAIGAREIEQLADDAENCYSLLRMRVEAFDLTRLELFYAVNDALYEAVEAFSDDRNVAAQVNRVRQQLKEYSSELMSLIGIDSAS